MTPIGKHIRYRRLALGLTQIDLAEKAGVNNNYLSMIELGHRQPSPETEAALAVALGVDGFEGPPPEMAVLWPDTCTEEIGVADWCWHLDTNHEYRVQILNPPEEAP